MEVNKAFKELVAERRARMEEIYSKRGLTLEETIPQKLLRIKKELNEIKNLLKTIEEDKAKDRMREFEFDSNTIEEVAELRNELEELAKSKGLIQCEETAFDLSSAGVSQKLTTGLLKALSVFTSLITSLLIKVEKKTLWKVELMSYIIMKT